MMIKKQEKTLLKLSKVFELVLSIIILIIVFLGMMDLSRSVYQSYIVNFATPVEYSELNSFLAEGLLLVIGVELVVMLCLHVPGTLIEVLLFAIARKLILLPKTSGMIDLFLGILAIGIIFAIRKYLLNQEEKNMSLSNLYNLNEIKKYINKNRKIK
ncbi:MAG: hypothetical protein PUJ51_17015 [Clostridiales bacterium]|uniref:phosphate-starvation-inducible PsiE family protein n=1 Tax=Terrisporobacter sp. TaxID=1965305 RepID=UPI002A52582F|nr:hypothetical protein [Terrisporobacter sp.]MDD7756191.1 hypothetical protein [Clostridiales bacterium]MDY4136363.1 hypothetical protein [Terrisporobacter sp.]